MLSPSVLGNSASEKALISGVVETARALGAGPGSSPAAWLGHPGKPAFSHPSKAPARPVI